MSRWDAEDVHIIPNTHEATSKAALHGHGHTHITLKPEHLQALQAGKALAWWDGEYTNSISLSEPTGAWHP
jgi:hypothetical protein